MIGIPLGLAYTNVAEWLLHKHMLHGLGKDKANFWSFHWHEHHRESRKHDMFDPQYVRSVFTWSPQGKEALALVASALVHVPILPIFPFFTLTVWYRTLRYYQLHKRAHLDREWCKENLPWHYDHHMGRDQNANWCVTHPWFDHIMGTRKKYVYGEDAKPVAEEMVPKRKGFIERFVKSIFVDASERVRERRHEEVETPAAA
jgi:hypothetical protein